MLILEETKQQFTFCRQPLIEQNQETTVPCDLPSGICISNQVMPGEFLQGCILKYEITSLRIDI
jgi:hypothetical protein